MTFFPKRSVYTHPAGLVRLRTDGQADALPYLVMEPVEGRPIDEHCAALRIPTRERVRLCRSVCAAVSFAHRNLVFHREKHPGDRRRPDQALVSSLNNLASLLTTLGEHEEAGTLFGEAIAMAERLYGSGHLTVGVLKKNQTLLLAESGEFAGCERLTREALEVLRRKERIAEAESIRGGCLVGLGRREEADPLLRRGHQVLLESLGEDARQTRQAADRLDTFVSGPGAAKSSK